MSRPYIIIGGGGHASVLCDILLSQGREVRAIVCLEERLTRDIFSRVPSILCDKEAFELNVDEVLLINGIGALPNSNLRELVAEKFQAKGFMFGQVVASSACVSSFARLGVGVQVLHGAIIQTGGVIKEHTIVNTKASVDHDCTIGRFNHIAPNATLCGGVSIADNVFIGAGSIITQCVSVGNSVVIGAGAVVTKDVCENTVVFPAKNIVKDKM